MLFHKEYLRAIDDGDNSEFQYLGKEQIDEEGKESRDDGGNDVDMEVSDGSDSGSDSDIIAPKQTFTVSSTRSTRGDDVSIKMTSDLKLISKSSDLKVN